MLDGKTRLRAILNSYQTRLPGESEIVLLSKLDARIVPLLSETIDTLPTTKDTLNGFVAIQAAIDDRLAELGHPEFRDHERLTAAKGYFAAPETTVEAAREHLVAYWGIREDLWKKIPKR